MEKGRVPNIVVLTGAGISAESGIKTFRDQDGLWEEHDIEEVATPRGFRKNPELVYRFYNERRRQANRCQPNAAHQGLAELEKILGDSFFLVTQNVDDLHEKAGSTRYCHMHGELNKVRCVKCHKVYVWLEDLDGSILCQNCKGKLRPHIVWFDEIPFQMKEIVNLLRRSDIYVAIGTSGQVYPAAGFYQFASEAGAYTVEINLTQTTSDFDCLLKGSATSSVPIFVNAVKKAIMDNSILVP
ncbi:MAG: NAD-dependent deacylase [Oligoflexales bacterium]|nr:NAD-dependent deacylase [Oligoflexales bacterium]